MTPTVAKWVAAPRDCLEAPLTVMPTEDRQVPLNLAYSAANTTMTNLATRLVEAIPVCLVPRKPSGINNHLLHNLRRINICLDLADPVALEAPEDITEDPEAPDLVGTITDLPCLTIITIWVVDGTGLTAIEVAAVACSP